MANTAPDPTNLRAWLALVQSRRLTLRIELSNGQTREGRLMSMLDDCLMLSPAAPGQQPRMVVLAHVVCLDIVEATK